jgi:hypothetical protein
MPDSGLFVGAVVILAIALGVIVAASRRFALRPWLSSGAYGLFWVFMGTAMSRRWLYGLSLGLLGFIVMRARLYLFGRAARKRGPREPTPGS